MLASFLTSILRLEWSLSPDEAACIASVLFAGEMCGALAWGFFGDFLGRRRCFLLSTGLTAIACTAIAFVPFGALWLLLALQFLLGVGVGGLAVPFDLLLEFLPLKWRRSCLLCYQFFWVAGSCYSTVVATMVLQQEQQHGDGGVGGGRGGDLLSDRRSNWRTLCLLSAAPLYVSVLCFPLLPESPAWLKEKGLHEAAQRTLAWALRLNRSYPTWWRHQQPLQQPALLPSRLRADTKLHGASSSLSPPPSIASAGGAAASKAGTETEALLQKQQEDCEEAKQVVRVAEDRYSRQSDVVLDGTSPDGAASAQANASLWEVLVELFAPHYRRTTLLLWLQWFTFGFVYYGLIIIFADTFRTPSPRPPLQLEPNSSSLAALLSPPEVNSSGTGSDSSTSAPAV